MPRKLLLLLKGKIPGRVQVQGHKRCTHICITADGWRSTAATHWLVASLDAKMRAACSVLFSVFRAQSPVVKVRHGTSKNCIVDRGAFCGANLWTSPRVNTFATFCHLSGPASGLGNERFPAGWVAPLWRKEFVGVVKMWLINEGVFLSDWRNRTTYTYIGNEWKHFILLV